MGHITLSITSRTWLSPDIEPTPTIVRIEGTEPLIAMAIAGEILDPADPLWGPEDTVILVEDTFHGITNMPIEYKDEPEHATADPLQLDETAA